VEVLVPDLGDFSDVEVIEVLVKPGDEVEAESPLITIETDKAAMDVPSPARGRVAEVKVGLGDRVSTGDLIVLLEAGTGAEAPEQETVAAEPGGAAPDETTVVADHVAPDVAHQSVAVPVIVPDLGDFADVEIVEVLVSPGDTVQAEQGLVTLETDKAAMDVPSTRAGVITELLVSVGDRVSAGDAVAMLKPAAAQAQAPAPSRAAPAESAEPEPTGKPATAPPAAAAPPRPAARLPAIDESTFGRAHASPSVRKLARELGVDLGRVQGSGRKNRVTADDVKGFVKQIMQGGASAAALPSVPEVDFARFGEIEVTPLSRIQKISGPRLHASWINLPHVTQHDLADITELEAARQERKAAALEQGVRLTPLAFIVRACALALNEFPGFRSSLSADGQSLVTKHYVHIGFAADTPNGLVVPVIRDADKKGVYALASDLATLSEAAREGKLKVDDMQGGVFTISSLGGIGGTAFTPIINAPEVAILGVSRSRWQPVYEGGEFVPRLMLPLSLSYDHRVIDGAEAVRFTTRLGELLSDVDNLLKDPS
jgi:pyruvate dehydrogenase E2 component (dihydrolipoamide acetyltransferase)